MLLATTNTLTDTVVAAAPIAERQLVAFDDAPAGADEAVKGVAANDAATGEAVAVTLIGIVDLVAGGAIAKGAKVVSDANGAPVTIGAGVNPFGTALTAAAQAGDRVRILIR